MSNIKLNQMTIQNFKGLTSFSLDLGGDNTVIKAENGVGKTTVYDAFLWLLFGKDSTGRKDFELRPLDRYNQPIKGVVLAVESELDIDGTNHVFRKEHHEKVVKGQLRGYETLCWIDEVPKKVGEYAEYIAELISEDTFKLLTDLHYFNNKMHWTERRKVLLDIAGKIGTPEGFDELLATLNGRTVEEYKKVLSEQKKRHTKERDEINPRIDEILKGLDHPACDTAELEKRRTELKTEIDQLKILRQELHGKETERQKKRDEFNQLTLQKIKREGELASDTSGVLSLQKEMIEISGEVSKAKELVSTAENELGIAKARMTGLNNETTSLLASLNTVREEYKTASEKSESSTCYACGQKLPADKLALNEEKRQASLNEITARGDELKRKVDENKKLVVALSDNIKLLTEVLEQSKKDVLETQTNAEKRLAEIDEAIKNRPTTPPEQDEQWNKIVAEIAKVEKEIGAPVSEQLEAIESERTTKEFELNGLDHDLAQADRMVKDRIRITELEALEKELAQKIADIEKQLADIERYKAVQSTMITNAVNCKFKVAEFKMFNELLNGGLEETCEATYRGVPYPDMSSGQQICVGIDIVNVLSEDYGVSVPMFIDHSESMTLPIESHSQTIELYAEKGIKQLQVNTKSERKAVA